MIKTEELRRIWANHTPSLLSARTRYAVLCPVLERPDGLHVLLEVRAAGLKQGGEVCFPGGRAEPEETFEACALRETFEELSIPPKEIELIGKTDFICVPGKSLIQPLLGLVSPSGVASISPSPAEVAEVFTVPLSFLQDTAPDLYTYRLKAQIPENFPYDTVGIRQDYPWKGGEAEVPIWQYDGHVIWGMTARILLDIIRHLKTQREP